MPSAIRAAQLADQIRDYSAEWIARDLTGYLITVTQVTLSPDMQKATIWVACYNQQVRAAALKRLHGLQKGYQRMLYQKLKRHSAPLINFVEDTSLQEAERLDNLLK